MEEILPSGLVLTNIETNVYRKTMNRTNLMAVQEGGAKLVMMDGTIWLIAEDDVEKTMAWEPPCNILIEEGSALKEYDYRLTNLDNDLTASAKRRR